MRTVFLILTVAITFFSCRKEKTTWDSDWRVPLIQDSLTLHNLVKDSILAINPDGSYHLVINRDILNLSIDSLLQLPDTSIFQKVVIAVSSLNVPPGISFINQTESHEFEVDDLILKKVILSSGQARIKLSSPIAAPTILTLTLPSVKKNNLVYTRTLDAPAGSLQNPSILTETFDLAGYEIDLTGPNGNLFNIIQSQVAVRTDPNGPTINVTNKDTVVFEVFFENLVPSYAQGYFGNQVFSDTTTFDFDLLNKIVAGTIDIENTSLTLSLRNGLKSSARSRFTLVENTGVSGNTIALNHPEIGPWIFINQATGNWNSLVPSIHDILFTNSNSNIEPFIENIPKFLKIGYAFELNPWGNTSGGWDEFFSSSQVTARLTADMPLAIGMTNLTYADTFNLKFENNAANFALKEGNIEIQTHSSYSFDAGLQLLFLDQLDNVLVSKISNEKIKGASSNTNNTSPQQIVQSKLVLSLSETEIKQLEQLDKIVVKAIFDTPQNGAISTFYEGQFIAFKLFTNLKLTTQL